MKKSYFILLFSIITLLSCLNKNKFVGKWERHTNVYGSIWKYYQTLYEDGSFKFQLFDCTKNGTWEVKGDSLITTINEKDNSKTTVKYKIVRINKKEMFLKYLDNVQEYYKVED